MTDEQFQKLQLLTSKAQSLSKSIETLTQDIEKLQGYIDNGCTIESIRVVAETSKDTLLFPHSIEDSTYIFNILINLKQESLNKLQHEYNNLEPILCCCSSNCQCKKEDNNNE